MKLTIDKSTLDKLLIHTKKYIAYNLNKYEPTATKIVKQVITDLDILDTGTLRNSSFASSKDTTLTLQTVETSYLSTDLVTGKLTGNGANTLDVALMATTGTGSHYRKGPRPYLYISAEEIIQNLKTQ
jgi:hypothetical protein